MSEDLSLHAVRLSRQLNGGYIVIGEKRRLITRTRLDKVKKDLTIWAEGMERVLLDGGLWKLREIGPQKYLLIKVTNPGPHFKYDPSWVIGRLELK